MKKLFLLLLIPAILSAQGIRTNGTLIVKSNLYSVLESKLSSIVSINGKTWACFPKDDLIITDPNVVIIDGFPVIYIGDEKTATLPDKKIDLIQLNFKTKKKPLIKGGSYKDCLGFPKDAQKKVRAKLKKIKDDKKVKNDNKITTSSSL